MLNEDDSEAHVSTSTVCDKIGEVEAGCDFLSVVTRNKF